MAPEGYIPRLIDREIPILLKSFGAISIQGPLGCGKTRTALHHSNSAILMEDETGPVQVGRAVALDPVSALRGETPHLIDEWQRLPILWDAVRSEVDRRREKGRFILTGSSVPRRDSYIHSGAGRIDTVPMRTMTLFESGDSDGSVSLRGLFDHAPLAEGHGSLDIDRLTGLCVRGGWPGAVGDASFARGHLDRVVEYASRIDGKRRDTGRMTALFRTLARCDGTTASDRELMSDMEANGNGGIAASTFRDYMACFRRTLLIDDILPFNPCVGPDVVPCRSPKRRLADLSLAVAALRMDADALKGDPGTLGRVFGALCDHDLRVYAESVGGRFSHYGDSLGNRMDAVVEMDDGRWGAFGTAVGPDGVDDTAGNLLSTEGFFRENGSPPSLLCVICGLATCAYRRPDGVYVVPITSLGP